MFVNGGNTMTNLIYAIKVNELIYSGLRVLDVKIGKTTDIQRTLKQYRRSGRGIEVLDLWEPNNKLTLSQCEVGVQCVAERYAYSKESEKFIFLQDRYDEFSDNVSNLLKKTSALKSPPKRIIKSGKTKKEKYTGKKPKYVKFKNKTHEIEVWRDVVRIVAKQIYDEVDDFNKVLDIKGKTRVYFAKNRKNKLMISKPIHGTPFYFEGNLNATQLMNITYQMLNIFGYDESDLDVGFK